MLRQTRKQRTYQTESLENRMLLTGDLIARWNADSLAGNEDGANVAVWTDQQQAVQATIVGAPQLVKGAI